MWSFVLVGSNASSISRIGGQEYYVSWHRCLSWKKRVLDSLSYDTKYTIQHWLTDTHFGQSNHNKMCSFQYIYDLFFFVYRRGKQPRSIGGFVAMMIDANGNYKTAWHVSAFQVLFPIPPLSLSFTWFSSIWICFYTFWFDVWFLAFFLFVIC
jgi:hypothetical protein